MHMGNQGAHAVENAVSVGVHQIAPILVRGLKKRHLFPHACGENHRVHGLRQTGGGLGNFLGAPHVHLLVALTLNIPSDNIVALLLEKLVSPFSHTTHVTCNDCVFH